MEANEYQRLTVPLATYPGQGTLLGLIYTSLGLGGEAGEALEKIKKLLRDGFQDLTPEEISVKLLKSEMPEEVRQAILKELGDVQWYLANAAKELGFTLDEVMQANLDKLNSRKERGKLHGSGDNR